MAFHLSSLQQPFNWSCYCTLFLTPYFRYQRSTTAISIGNFVITFMLLVLFVCHQGEYIIYLECLFCCYFSPPSLSFSFSCGTGMLCPPCCIWNWAVYEVWRPLRNLFGKCHFCGWCPNSRESGVQCSSVDAVLTDFGKYR